MESTVRWRTPLTLLPYILFSVEGNQYFYTTLPIEHLPESTNHRGKYHFTSDLTIICLDSAALLVWHEQQFFLFGQIETSQTGGQPYSGTSPYCECSLCIY